MYLLMRNTHLFLGIVFTLFLLMYGVSAVQMSHPDWFPMEPTVTESRVTIPPGHAGGARAVAHVLMEREGLRGEVSQVRETAGGYDFRIVRPGTVYEISYLREPGSAHVRTNVSTFMGMLNRIHHIGGLSNEYPLLNVWGLLVALVSVGLIALGVSGIYLWFRIHRERRIGAALLGGSLALSLTLMIWMRLAA